MQPEYGTHGADDATPRKRRFATPVAALVIVVVATVACAAYVAGSPTRKPVAAAVDSDMSVADAEAASVRDFGEVSAETLKAEATMAKSGVRLASSSATVPETTSYYATCSKDNPMCIVNESDLGLTCPNSCGMATNYIGDGADGTPSFTGCGASICTCYFWGSQAIETLTLDRRADGDAGRCAAACEAHPECNYAFYARWKGQCRLLRSCTSTLNTWVGQVGKTQGGTTFMKWQRPLMVDAGEENWPIEWFGGPYTQSSWTDASASYWQAWTAEAGTHPGYDWGLPASVTQSPRGSPILFRTFSGLDVSHIRQSVLDLEDYTNDPHLTPTACFWIKWKDVEKVQGEYDWSGVDWAMQQLGQKGWRVAVRLLSGRKDHFAPAWVNDLGIPLYGEGYDSFDPTHPTMRQLYKDLVASLGATNICSNPNLISMYVGYVSKSNGDEHIGPKIQGSVWEEDTEVVKERLDAFAAMCAGYEYKVVMGGPSRYGFELGFGIRGGFVEHYLYEAPYEPIGSTWSEEDPYLRTDENALIFQRRGTNGDENEEYERGWASNFESCPSMAPNDKGYECVTPWGHDKCPGQCAPIGSKSRFGSLESFNYRYMMSNIRSSQMQLTYNLMNEFTLDPPLAMWMLLNLGRSAEEAPDAFSFLIQAEMDIWSLDMQGTLKNFERWLYQRDSGDVETIREGKVRQTPDSHSSSGGTWMTSEPYDYIARAALGGMIGFTLDRGFSGCDGSMDQVVIKVTYFDYVDTGTIAISADGCTTTLAEQPTVNDRQLKTATFPLGSLPLADGVGGYQGAEAGNFDFEVCGFDDSGEPQEIIVSFVRVIKANPPPTPPVEVDASVGLTLP